jgi:hypothetical protein
MVPVACSRRLPDHAAELVTRHPSTFCFRPLVLFIIDPVCLQDLTIFSTHDHHYAAVHTAVIRLPKGALATNDSTPFGLLLTAMESIPGS